MFYLRDTSTFQLHGHRWHPFKIIFSDTFAFSRISALFRNLYGVQISLSSFCSHCLFRVYRIKKLLTYLLVFFLSHFCHSARIICILQTQQMGTRSNGLCMDLHCIYGYVEQPIPIGHGPSPLISKGYIVIELWVNTTLSFCWVLWWVLFIQK